MLAVIMDPQRKRRDKQHGRQHDERVGPAAFRREHVPDEAREEQAGNEPQDRERPPQLLGRQQDGGGPAGPAREDGPHAAQSLDQEVGGQQQEREAEERQAKAAHAIAQQRARRYRARCVAREHEKQGHVKGIKRVAHRPARPHMARDDRDDAEALHRIDPVQAFAQRRGWPRLPDLASPGHGQAL